MSTARFLAWTTARSRRCTGCALVIVTLTAAAGCGPALPDSVRQCLRRPGEWGEGRVRTGYVTARLGLHWNDPGADRQYGAAPVMRLFDRTTGCRHEVRVETGGASWTLGGYVRVDQFTVDQAQRRLAFVGFRDRTVHAVVDGREGPGHRGIIWPPTFSANGTHVGYLAEERDGAVLVVDGVVRDRAPGYLASNFVVLDDGRAMATRRRADGRVEVVLGDRVGPAFDGVCELSFAVSAAGRFAYVGKHGERHVGVVDHKEIDAPGTPAQCRIAFSPSGRHFGWLALHTGAGGRRSTEQGAVVDGVFHPLSGGGTEATFLEETLVVRLTTPDPTSMGMSGYKGWEHALWLPGVATPAVPPTADEYRPAPGYAGTSAWARVVIGRSRGPVLDAVKKGTLRLRADGRVEYVGVRGGRELRVVDNVIQPEGR